MGREVQHLRMNEGELFALLAKKFPSPTYALLRHVADATGAKQSRWADALAMGLWPSRGLDIYGFEIKSHRHDWLRELERPEKADPVARYCDYWFIVAPAGVVEIDELPSRWGLLEARGKPEATRKLFEKRPATRLEPIALDRRFVAALLRRVHEQLAPEVKLKKARADGVSEGWTTAHESFKDERARLERNAQAANEELGKIRQALGHNHWSFEIDEIGKAIRVLRHLTQNRGDVDRIAGAARQIAERTSELASLAKRILEKTNGHGTDPVLDELEMTE